MIPGAYPEVDALRQISFADALAFLQTMLGKHVTVEFNDHHRFLGCAFSGELERVETLPPDHVAIRLVLSGGSLFLDPEEVTVHVSGDCASGLGSLEFWVASGPSIKIEVPTD
jgi:hypothetical protein